MAFAAPSISLRFGCPPSSGCPTIWSLFPAKAGSLSTNSTPYFLIRRSLSTRLQSIRFGTRCSPAPVDPTAPVTPPIPPTTPRSGAARSAQLHPPGRTDVRKPPANQSISCQFNLPRVAARDWMCAGRRCKGRNQVLHCQDLIEMFGSNCIQDGQPTYQTKFSKFSGLQAR